LSSTYTNCILPTILEAFDGNIEEFLGGSCDWETASPRQRITRLTKTRAKCYRLTACCQTSLHIRFRVANKDGLTQVNIEIIGCLVQQCGLGLSTSTILVSPVGAIIGSGKGYTGSKESLMHLSSDLLKHRSIEQTFADRRLIRNDDHWQSQGRKLS
jgi:hypothetical protein